MGRLRHPSVREVQMLGHPRPPPSRLPKYGIHLTLRGVLQRARVEMCILSIAIVRRSTSACLELDRPVGGGFSGGPVLGRSPSRIVSGGHDTTSMSLLANLPDGLMAIQG